MFRLVAIEEVVQVPPKLFGLARFVAMEHEVNRKYSNKVLSGVGICIALWDWVSSEDHRLIPHTGDANTRCQFRMLVFAPFAGETLWGYVSRVCSDRVELDLEFVGGISIPKSELPASSTYDSEENAWRIRYDADEAEEHEEEEHEEEPVEVVLDVGNSVAFKVAKVIFTDGVDRPPEKPCSERKSKHILTVKASMQRHGLGRYEWWEDGGDADGDDADESKEVEHGDEYGEEGYGEEEYGEEEYDEEQMDPSEMLGEEERKVPFKGDKQEAEAQGSYLVKDEPLPAGIS